MDGLLEAVDRTFVVVALLEYNAAVIRDGFGYCHYVYTWCCVVLWCVAWPCSFNKAR